MTGLKSGLKSTVAAIAQEEREILTSIVYPGHKSTEEPNPRCTLMLLPKGKAWQVGFQDVRLFDVSRGNPSIFILLRKRA